MKRTVSAVLVAALLATLAACARDSGPSAWGINRETTGPTRFPLAIAPAAVGTYDGAVKSGAGYFYDDVLEYRVWLSPARGADAVAGGGDYFATFAQYERAAAFAKVTSGADEPLVLVRQREWIDEPQPGQFVPMKAERLAEWQVKWLAGAKREPDSITKFMANPRRAPAE